MCSRRCTETFHAALHCAPAAGRGATSGVRSGPGFAVVRAPRARAHNAVSAGAGLLSGPSLERLAREDRVLPEYVRQEFDEFLRCGVLEHGFLRVVCDQCHAERLVAFSCKRRGFCPSCGARRVAESARHLVEEVFGPSPVLGIAQRAI